MFSAYVYHGDAYILLDAGEICTVHWENEVEQAQVEAFIAQLQLNAYVFVYYTRNGRVLKIFDMLSGQILDCEGSDDSALTDMEEFSGILKFKTGEFMRPNYEACVFSVINEKETRNYVYLVDVIQAEKDKFGLMKLQAGDEVSVKENKDGRVVAIKDNTRGVIIGKYE